MIKIILVLIATIYFLIPGSAGAQITNSGENISSGVPNVNLNNIIDPQRFMDVLKKNIDVPRIEGILKGSGSTQAPALSGGIGLDTLFNFAKYILLDILHSAWGLIYNLMYTLGLEKYLRYLPRF